MGRKIIRSTGGNKTGFKYRVGYAGWAMFYCMICFLCMFWGIFAMMGSTPECFFIDANTPILLLEGYRNWWKIKGILTVVSIVVLVVLGVISCIQQSKLEKKRERQREYNDVIKYYTRTVRCRTRYGTRSYLSKGFPPGKIIFPMMLGMTLFMVAIYIVMNPSEKNRLYQEDIAAIAEGKLREETLCIYPDCEVMGLDNELTETVVCYETSGTDIYIPIYMDFVVDLHEDYNPNNDGTWLKKHSATYKVTYTPNFHLVTKVEMMKPAE